MKRPWGSHRDTKLSSRKPYGQFLFHVLKLLSKLISLAYHQNLHNDSWNTAAQDDTKIKEIA